MSRQLLLALVQLVQAAIQTILIDLLPRHSQQILQGRALIPAFGQAQLTRLGTKPGDRQQTGDPFPGNFLTTGRDQFVQQFMQTQAAPERERQVNFAKFTHPLDSNPAHLHLAPQRPLGLSRTAQFKLPGRGPARQQLIDRFPSDTNSLIQPRKFAQGSHNVLTGTTGRSARFHQRPILIRRASDRPTLPSQIHAPILHSPNPSPQRPVRHYKSLFASDHSRTIRFAHTYARPLRKNSSF